MWFMATLSNNRTVSLRSDPTHREAMLKLSVIFLKKKKNNQKEDQGHNRHSSDVRLNQGQSQARGTGEQSTEWFLSLVGHTQASESTA